MIARRKNNLHLGLLPRMEARISKRSGKVTYRYHPPGSSPINLGQDRVKAIMQVLDFENRAPDEGTFAGLVRRAMQSTWWEELGDLTRVDYLTASKPVLAIFGRMDPRLIKPHHIARYLRVERKDAKVRANREKAFMSGVFNFGIETGELTENPTRQVRRNKEKPRNRKPEIAEVNAFIQVAKAKGESSYIIALLGVLVGISGRRRAELRTLTLSALTDEGIRGGESKAKRDEADRTFLIGWSPFLRELVREIRAVPRPVGSLFLFPNRNGQPYTEPGFKAMWNKVMKDFIAAGGQHFTQHDLRAMYVTEMVERGENPETHRNQATTRRVYDRRRVVKVKPLI